jgi:hypothetical protein
MAGGAVLEAAVDLGGELAAGKGLQELHPHPGVMHHDFRNDGKVSIHIA